MLGIESQKIICSNCQQLNIRYKGLCGGVINMILHPHWSSECPACGVDLYTRKGDLIISGFAFYNLFIIYMVNAGVYAVFCLVITFGVGHLFGWLIGTSPMKVLNIIGLLIGAIIGFLRAELARRKRRILL